MNIRGSFLYSVHPIENIDQIEQHQIADDITKRENFNLI